MRCVTLAVIAEEDDQSPIAEWPVKQGSEEALETVVQIPQTRQVADIVLLGRPVRRGGAERRGHRTFRNLTDRMVRAQRQNVGEDRLAILRDALTNLHRLLQHWPIGIPAPPARGCERNFTQVFHAKEVLRSVPRFE